MRKAGENDSLTQAVELLRKTVLSERRAARRPSTADIGELFVAELQERRQRLQQWLRLINAEASGKPCGAGAMVRTRASTHRCRTTRTAPI